MSNLIAARKKDEDLIAEIEESKGRYRVFAYGGSVRAVISCNGKGSGSLSTHIFRIV